MQICCYPHLPFRRVSFNQQSYIPARAQLAPNKTCFCLLILWSTWSLTFSSRFFLRQQPCPYFYQIIIICLSFNTRDITWARSYSPYSVSHKLAVISPKRLGFVHIFIFIRQIVCSYFSSVLPMQILPERFCTVPQVFFFCQILVPTKHW